ncbi:hypothetical protein VTO73DRAFT_14111 [Trametes versicolor]
MSLPEGVSELLASLPEEDADVLRVSQDKQQLLSLATDRIEHYASHIQTLNALRNLLAPIHRLPAEILMAIFYRCRRTVADIRLAHICRHWRSLILGMPQFWAAMLGHLQFHPLGDPKLDRRYRRHYKGLLQQCLELSAPRLVKCRVVLLSGPECRTLAPHLDRLTELSVTFFFGHAVYDVAAILVRGLPNLVTLRLEENVAIASWEDLPSLDSCPLPVLRRLDIPGDWPLSRFITSSLENLVLRPGDARYDIDVDDVIDALESSSLVSLTVHYDGAIDLWDRLLVQEKIVRLPRLRKLSLIGELDLIETYILPRLALSPSVHICLSFPQATERWLAASDVARHATTLRAHLPGLASITRLYLGNTRSQGGRVKLLGFAEQEDGTDAARLDMGKWHTRPSAVLEMLDFVASAPVTALAVSLSRPTLAALQSPDPSGHPAVLALPQQLRRLELLVRTPLDTKLWLASSFLNLCASEQAGRPSSEQYALCWVLHIERGREALVQEELQALEDLLMESPGYRLGRLELYGTMAQSGQIYTKAAEVPTNRARCAELVGPFTARLGALVGQLVII